MRAVRRPLSPSSARAGLAARGPLLALVLAALPACATSGIRADGGAGSSGATPAGAVPMARGGSAVADVSATLMQGGALTRDPMRPLADVIESYWSIASRRDPRSVRSTVGDESVGVYSSTGYLGGWDYLRTLRSSHVLRVQRLTASEAYHRFGRSHVNGAVVLTLKPGIRG